jgi:hypothetical protein
MKPKTVLVRISADSHQALKKYCKKHDRRLTSVISNLITSYLARFSK